MLNLSDNELDRLSREAASQHDPGDLLGPQAWERLQVRLDKELGRAGPDASRGLRSIRRLPFQYAPMILLILGVSYYFVKQAIGRKAGNSGSPPLTVVKTPQQQGTSASDSSLKHPIYSDKSTSTPYPTDQSQNTNSAPTSTEASTDAASGTSSGSAATSTGSATTSSRPKDLTSSTTAGSNIPGSTSSGRSRTLSAPNTLSGTRHRNGHNQTALTSNKDKKAGHTNKPTDLSDGSTAGSTPGSSTRLTPGQNTQPGSSVETGPERSFIQRPFSLRRNHPAISDSALRAYTAQTPTNPGKKSGPSLRVNRSLTFGFQVAPDFSSVNALAGDKAGSTFGFTVDYQFANRLYIGTGLLYTRKNYTARTADYHVDPYYLQRVSPKPIDFVKGSMTMLEIPLNLRYDFSVTGNTLFFASGGLSTYLFGGEHTNYYYEAFGREQCREIRYSNKPGIFSAANLSLGVETGISNDFSLLVAPYMKVPLSGIGFGKINVSSVGINLGIRYSPVISRKRKH